MRSVLSSLELVAWHPKTRKVIPRTQSLLKQLPNIFRKINLPTLAGPTLDYGGDFITAALMVSAFFVTRRCQESVHFAGTEL